MAHMHVSMTFILVFGIICSVAGLTKDSRKSGMGSSSKSNRNPFYQRYLSKVLNGSSGSDYNLGKLGNPIDALMWQLHHMFYHPTLYYGWEDYKQRKPSGAMSGRMQYPVRSNFGGNYNNPYTMSRGSLKANYPTANYGVGSYNQLNPLGSMSGRTQNPMELNFGGNNNFIPSTMGQVSRRETYPGAYYRMGSYSQSNRLRSMSERTHRPTGLYVGGNYFNLIPTTMSSVSQRANYPTAYHGMGSYSQLNPLGSNSERTQRPMGWNFGGNNNNPTLSTMSQNSPRANYPTAYYGVGSYNRPNALGSITGRIQRPIGWLFGGISNNLIHSSTRPDTSGASSSAGDNDESNSTQSKPFDTIPQFITHPVVWPFGGIYNHYGEHIFHFPVRYYGYTLGSPLVLTHRVLYPKIPFLSHVTHNIHHSRDPDHFVAPCPIQSSADTDSYGSRSSLINRQQGLSFAAGHSVSPVSPDINPVTSNRGLGLNNPQEAYNSRYHDTNAPGSNSYASIRPIVLCLGNINSGYNNNSPGATSITRNIQNIPNAIDFGQNSQSRLDCYGNGNYPTASSFNMMTRGIGRPIGYNTLSPSHGTQYPVGQSVNHESYTRQDPFAYQRSAPQDRVERHEVLNPTNYPASTLPQPTQSSDFLERFDRDGHTRQYGVQLPLHIIYLYPKSEAHKAWGYDS